MNPLARAICLLFLMAVGWNAARIPALAQTPPLTFKVWAAPAPNRYTGQGGVAWTAYHAWVAKAMDSIENGKGNIGDPTTDASAYQIVSGVMPRYFAISGVTSWRALLDPTGPAADQYGNAMHFPLHVKGDGTVRFKYEDISWCAYTPEAPDTVCNTMRLPRPHSAGAWDRVDCTYGWGYDWGNDRVKGGGDDVKVCGGSQEERGNFDSTLVDELFYIGANYAHAADHRYNNASQFPGYVDYTLQEVFDDFCERHNSDPNRKAYGLEFTIIASDGNTYKYLAKRSNPEWGQPLQPGKCLPYPLKTRQTVAETSAAPPAAPVYTCEDLQRQGYRITATHGLRSGLQCQALSAAGVGNAAALAAGFIDAIDVWGYAEQDVTVCFPNPPLGAGLLFLDATAAPRTLTPLESFYGDDQICATIYRPGTIVLVRSGAPTPAPVSATSRPLSDCMVTTQYALNFRETPSLSGKKIGTGIPYKAMLTALARAADWFKVDFHGVQGWISARYVKPSGNCA